MICSKEVKRKTFRARSFLIWYFFSFDFSLGARGKGASMGSARRADREREGER